MRVIGRLGRLLARGARRFGSTERGRSRGGRCSRWCELGRSCLGPGAIAALGAGAAGAAVAAGVLGGAGGAGPAFAAWFSGAAAGVAPVVAGSGGARLLAPTRRDVLAAVGACGRDPRR